MFKKLIAVSPDPLEWLKQIKYVGTRLGYMERLDLASYDSIGVYLKIRITPLVQSHKKSSSFEFVRNNTFKFTIFFFLYFLLSGENTS